MPLFRLCNEENDAPEKSKQASSVVNLILPEVQNLCKKKKKESWFDNFMILA